MNEPAGGNVNVANANSSAENKSEATQPTSSSDQDRQQLRETAGAAAQMTSEACHLDAGCAGGWRIGCTVRWRFWFGKNATENHHHDDSASVGAAKDVSKVGILCIIL